MSSAIQCWLVVSARRLTGSTEHDSWCAMGLSGLIAALEAGPLGSAEAFPAPWTASRGPGHTSAGLGASQMMGSRLV